MNPAPVEHKGRFSLGLGTATGRLILGSITVVFTAHLILFLLYASTSALEAEYRTPLETGTAYSAFLAGWGMIFGQSLFATRIISAFCALATVVFMARITVRWSGDEATGAALPLGLVLFPPTAFIFTQSTPHAMTALLTVLAVTAVTCESDQRRPMALIKAGLICALLPTLHAMGLGLSVAILVIAFIQLGFSRVMLTFSAGTAAGIIGLGFLFHLSPEAFPQERLFQETTGVTWMSAVMRHYAMLWVALAFSVMALAGSRALRDVLGQNGVRRSVALLAAFAIALMWMMLNPGGSPNNGTLAINAVLVLGIMAAMPMVLWVRLIMPRIRSVFIWILLPVIMYSCFWVVLGPIDLQGFPYDRLTPENILWGTQAPG